MKKIILFLIVSMFMISLVSASIDYTSTSKTVCDGATCIKTLHSGVRYVEEDNQWKKVEDARSLKDKGFNILVLEDDGEYPVEVIDFNYSSIQVKLNPKGIKIFNENIPVRIWERNSTKAEKFYKDLREGKKNSKGVKDYKDKMNKIVEDYRSFNLLNQEDVVTYNFGLGKVLEFGFNSTTIILQDADSEVLDDSQVYNNSASTNYGSETTYKLNDMSGNYNYYIYQKFNISEIPDNSDIKSSELFIYIYHHTHSAGEKVNVSTHHVYANYSWTEEGITWINKPKETNYSSSFSDTMLFDGDGVIPDNQFISFNTTQIVRDSYNLLEENTTIFLRPHAEINCDPADYLGFNSKEHPTTSSRPYLNITYTPPDTTPPDITITSPSNQTYNTQTIAFNITTEDASAISSCWYSLDDFATNLSMTNLTQTLWNATNTTMTQGGHRINFVCNDSSNNINNSEYVDIFIDSIFPEVTIVNTNRSNSTDTGLDINYTYIETNPDTCWYSNDSYDTNTTLGSCGTNITGVTWVEGYHNLTIWINDTGGNENSSRISFTIDTTPPTFTDISNQNVYTNETLSHNINASEQYMEVHKFVINDTSIFSINADTGVLTNSTTMPSGTYALNVSVNDTLNNLASQEITITVSNYDSYDPYFNPALANQSIYDNETLNYDIDATDNEGNFHKFAINWTSTFSINADTGVLTNTSGLSVRTYGINVSINDTFGNLDSDIFYLNINFSDLTPPTISISYPLNTTYNFEVTKINYTYTEINPNKCWWNDGDSNSSSVNMGTNFSGISSNEGDNIWTVYCNDSAGNEGYSSISFYTIPEACSDLNKTGYRLIGLFMGLLIPLSTFYFITKKKEGWQNLELGDIVIIGISIIIALTLYTQSASLLGGICGSVTT